ncbi:MAG: hypothetical protein U5L74_01555 [Ideonella sp.]|nr:hypothetical protein [Ideonella sp.]
MNTTTTHATLQTLATTLEGLALALASEGYAASHPLSLAVDEASRHSAHQLAAFAEFARQAAAKSEQMAEALDSAMDDDMRPCVLPVVRTHALHLAALCDGANIACGGAALRGGLNAWMGADELLRLVDAVAGAGVGTKGGAA